VFSGTLYKSQYVFTRPDLDAQFIGGGMRHFQFNVEVTYPERYLTTPLAPLLRREFVKSWVMYECPSTSTYPAGRPRKRALSSPVPIVSDEPSSLMITDVRSLAGNSSQCVIVTPLNVSRDLLLAPDESPGVDVHEVRASLTSGETGAGATSSSDWGAPCRLAMGLSQECEYYVLLDFSMT